MNQLLIIIPAYNEEKNIEYVVNQIIEHYPQYDYVIVNDGSKDRTSAICHKNGYEIIDLPINLGLAGAFQTGMRYAAVKGYEYAIQLDADGQHLPEFVETMKKKMDQGYDIVIGSRFISEKKPKSMRMLGSNLIEKAIRVTAHQKIADPTSGMRMFNKEMIHEFASNINYGPEPDTISFLIKQGAKVAEVQVEMKERMAGESYLNWAKSISYMLKMSISIMLIQNFRKRVVVKNID